MAPPYIFIFILQLQYNVLLSVHYGLGDQIIPSTCETERKIVTEYVNFGIYLNLHHG